MSAAARASRANRSSVPSDFVGPCLCLRPANETGPKGPAPGLTANAGDSSATRGPYSPAEIIQIASGTAGRLRDGRVWEEWSLVRATTGASLLLKRD